MKPTIPPGLSLYLDVMRLAAALVVVFSHTWTLLFPAFPLPWPGHSAVVVFFVLSGYVISHAAKPELGLFGYFQHRIARIVPVAFGALILSVLIAPYVGLNKLQYSGPMVFSWTSIAINAVFLGQSWIDIAPMYNPPFWSLNYEVWYYILFGVWVYKRNFVALLMAAAIAGPKILLLMPVWLIGVTLHRWMGALSKRTAVLLFLATVIAGLGFFWFDTGVLIRSAMEDRWPAAMELARGSNQFVGDFLLGIICGLNFVAVGSLDLKPLIRFKAVIRFFSSYTFSIYVFHMPVTVLLWNGLGVRSPLLFFCLLVAAIVILGELTERRTNWYRSALQRMFVRTAATV